VTATTAEHATATATGTAPDLDVIAQALPQRVSTLTRLFLKTLDPPLSRLEASVLAALAERPYRITDLAAREAVSQPGISLLVNRLQERGWVSRQPDERDGRVVLVALTPAGQQVLDHLRLGYRALMHEEMTTLAEHDVYALARTIDILDRLIARLSAQES
jgi:DNA-binding MarR family transcriptional regulator